MGPPIDAGARTPRSGTTPPHAPALPDAPRDRLPPLPFRTPVPPRTNWRGRQPSELRRSTKCRSRNPELRVPAPPRRFPGSAPHSVRGRPHYSLRPKRPGFRAGIAGFRPERPRHRPAQAVVVPVEAMAICTARYRTLVAIARQLGRQNLGSQFQQHVAALRHWRREDLLRDRHAEFLEYRHDLLVGPIGRQRGDLLHDGQDHRDQVGRRGERRAAGFEQIRYLLDDTFEKTHISPVAEYQGDFRLIQLKD